MTVKSVNIFKAVTSCFFPNNCLGCGQVLAEDEYFCDYCYNTIEHIQVDKACKKCGIPKKHCSCGRYVFHFDASVAPLRNDGPAKEAMRKFKFHHKAHYGKYFAEQMSLMVKQRYMDREFDLIVYVPMSTFAKLKRGYNQSFVLAAKLSEILNIPLGNNILKCKHKTIPQRELSGKERFKNIKGKFSCNKSLFGKRILLVDDIKTTGATLDECSKQLMTHGAESVCCITALTTYKEKKKEKRKREKSNGN